MTREGTCTYFCVTPQHSLCMASHVTPRRGVPEGSGVFLVSLTPLCSANQVVFDTPGDHDLENDDYFKTPHDILETDGVLAKPRPKSTSEVKVRVMFNVKLYPTCIYMRSNSCRTRIFNHRVVAASKHFC